MNKEELFAIPGVVSVGRTEGGYKVQILKGYPLKEIPAAAEGVPVIVEVVTETPRPPMQAYINMLRERHRPLRPGVQIALGFGHGSAGFMVYWRGKPYLITAAHLLHQWQAGEPVYQPARGTTRIVGSLSRWIDIYQYNGLWWGVEGDAMALELSEDAVNELPRNELTADHFTEPELGKKFIRVGRTTGRQEDHIVEVDATVRMAGIGDNPHWTCRNVFKGRFYSALPGDSGGGIFTPDGGILGLCMHPQGGCAVSPSLKALGMGDATLEPGKIETKLMDTEPILHNSRTMVPIRFVAEELGCQVDWDGSDRSVTITDEKGRVVKMWIGRNEYVVKGG